MNHIIYTSEILFSANSQNKMRFLPESCCFSIKAARLFQLCSDKSRFLSLLFRVERKGQSKSQLSRGGNRLTHFIIGMNLSSGGAVNQLNSSQVRPGSPDFDREQQGKTGISLASSRLLCAEGQLYSKMTATAMKLYTVIFYATLSCSVSASFSFQKSMNRVRAELRYVPRHSSDLQLLKII